MGYYFIVKNVTQRHQLNSVWKNFIPETSYIQEIGLALDWNPSDIIVLECEDSWAILKDGKWEWQPFHTQLNVPILTHFLKQNDMFRDSNGYLTIDDNEVYEAIQSGVFVKAELQKYLCYNGEPRPRPLTPVDDSKVTSSRRFDFSDDEF